MIFSKAKMFFCTKHIHANVKEDLKACTPRVRNEILTQMFGSNGWGEGGLTDATDVDVDFKRKMLAIDRSAFPPGKFDYHTKKILHNVKTRLECKGAIEANITSNSVEAINGATKFYVDFKIEQLPDLIDTLREMAEFAKAEFIQAFTGRGSILLTGPLGHQFSFRPDVWEFKTPEQRENIFSSFAKGGRRMLNQKETVTSTNGIWTMNNTGDVKQKINHRKRPTRQRTLDITPSKGFKRRKLDDDE